MDSPIGAGRAGAGRASNANRVLAAVIPGMRAGFVFVGEDLGISVSAAEEKAVANAVASLARESETFDCGHGIGMTITNRFARLSALRPLLFYSDYGTAIDSAYAEEPLEWISPEELRGPVVNRSIRCIGAVEERSYWYEGLIVWRRMVNDLLHSISVTLRQPD